MKKEEFMRELEYLLQDIPEEEKEDAIAYYRDYLEEAGADKEEAAIQEFGSPERLAAIIRADLNGNLEEGGEFTESGYGDERFKEPNFQLARRLDLPEEKEPEGGGKDGAGHGSGGASPGFRSGRRGAGACLRHPGPSGGNPGECDDCPWGGNTGSSFGRYFDGDFWVCPAGPAGSGDFVYRDGRGDIRPWAFMPGPVRPVLRKVPAVACNLVRPLG